MKYPAYRFVDGQGNKLHKGDRVQFTPAAGNKPSRRGTVLADHALGSVVDVILDGDPFGSYVESKQLRNLSSTEKNRRSNEEMPATKAAPAAATAKELRRAAKAAGLAGWESMSLNELRAAVGDAPAAPRTTSRVAAAKQAAQSARPQKTVKAKAVAPAKKAPAAKKAAAAVESNGANPFRENTNLWHITEALIRGGKRSTLVTSLKRKIELKPRTQTEAEFDLDAEMDRRVLIVGQILRKEHGFLVNREGRGTEATIQAIPPQ